MELSMSTADGGPVPIVVVGGEVDVYSAPQLRNQLIEILESGPSTAIVDLTGVEFIDSTGLGALVAARTTAADRGGSLALVCTHQRIIKLFTITGLDGVFRIHDTVAAALAALEAPSAVSTPDRPDLAAER
jgi:anti-sigma B factor antagonist